MEHEINIAEKKFLHDYHSAIYKLIHVPLDWIGLNHKNFTICSMEHCNPLCAKLMEYAEGAQLCTDLKENSLYQAKKQKQPIIYQCHAGFYDAVIPIFSDDRYLGSLCVGQFLLKKPRESELKKIRKTLSFCNFEPGELEKYLNGTRIFTEAEMEGLIKLVQILETFIRDYSDRINFLESMNRIDSIYAAELFIQKHYAQSLTVDMIARAVGISKSHFLHKFSNQTGISPIAYLNQYRVEKASELLKDSNLTIGEISGYCGFGSLDMFIRHFRKFYGKTPLEYRKEKQKTDKKQSILKSIQQPKYPSNSN
ncbi:MAG: PocR ligand-binding domain-containing protein [Lentisphaeria bacterium]|nr:PocR ligand-binding domain-containing protein [Lentisphaeria bacterium]